MPVKKNLVRYSLLLVLIYAASSWALVSPRGTEDNFEIATWNVQDFPRNGQATIDTLAILINDLQLDLIGMEEIADTVAFANLLSRLNGWDGAYAPSYPGSILKDGVLYRTDQINIISSEGLFWGFTYEFPRPPFRATIEADLPSGHFDFYLIVLHLKAGSQASDVSRRIAAMTMLKNYLDINVPSTPNQDWLIIGDYNDDVDDPQASNIFWNFLQDSTNYKILTLPLAGNPYWASYPTYNSLIDHIIITSDAMTEYGANGQTMTLRLDDEYNNYRNMISDHRPVMSRFTQMESHVGEQLRPPADFSLSFYPNPFNGDANISIRLFQSGNITLQLYDCLGRKRISFANQFLEAGNYLFRLDGQSLNSGVYFLELANEGKSKVIKVNLIK
jgi:endonuclease/exonuclease/phosphatase family metal-dependent hydrolase